MSMSMSFLHTHGSMQSSHAHAHTSMQQEISSPPNRKRRTSSPPPLHNEANNNLSDIRAQIGELNKSIERLALQQQTYRSSGYSMTPSPVLSPSPSAPPSTPIVHSQSSPSISSVNIPSFNESLQNLSKRLELLEVSVGRIADYLHHTARSAEIEAKGKKILNQANQFAVNLDNYGKVMSEVMTRNIASVDSFFRMYAMTARRELETARKRACEQYDLEYTEVKTDHRSLEDRLKFLNPTLTREEHSHLPQSGRGLMQKIADKTRRRVKKHIEESAEESQVRIHSNRLLRVARDMELILKKGSVRKPSNDLMLSLNDFLDTPSADFEQKLEKLRKMRPLICQGIIGAVNGHMEFSDVVSADDSDYETKENDSEDEDENEGKDKEDQSKPTIPLLDLSIKLPNLTVDEFQIPDLPLCPQSAPTSSAPFDFVSTVSNSSSSAAMLSPRFHCRSVSVPSPYAGSVGAENFEFEFPHGSV